MKSFARRAALLRYVWYLLLLASLTAAALRREGEFLAAVLIVTCDL